MLASTLLLGPERAITPAVKDASPHKQYVTDAAAGPDIALIVWLEEQSSVRAARIDRDGRQLETRALVLASGNTSRSAPAVARGTDGWLVVWWERQRVVGRRVDDEGNAGPLLDIAAAANDSAPTTVVAFRDSQFFVIWNGVTRTVLTRLGANGQVLEGDIELHGAGVRFTQAEVIATSSGFALVYTPQAFAPPHTVEIQHLDTHGHAVAHELLAEATTDVLSLTAARAGDGDGDVILALWMTELGIGRRIHAARSGEAGRVIADGNGWLAGIVAMEGRWFTLTLEQNELHLQPLDGGAAHSWSFDGLVGHASMVSFGDRAVMAMTVYPSWSLRGLETSDPYALLVDASLADIGPLRRITPEPRLQTDPAVARNSHGEILVAWLEPGVETLPGVVAQRLDASGRPLDLQPLRIGDAPVVGGWPRVATDGDDFLVMWQGGEGLKTRRVLRDGTLSASSNIGITLSIDSCVCWAGTQYLVATVEGISIKPPKLEIHLSELNRQGNAASTTATPLASGLPYNVSCAAGPRSTMVAWRRDGLETAIVSHGGTRSAVIPVGSPPMTRRIWRSIPSIAVASDGFALAWPDDGVVQRALVNAQGTVTRPDDAPIASDGDSARIVPFGGGFALMWNSDDDLYVTRLDSSARATGEPMALPATGGIERSPVLTEGLAVYVRDTESEVEPRWRIFTRTLLPTARRRAAAPR